MTTETGTQQEASAESGAARMAPHLERGLRSLARELNERRGLRVSLLGGLMIFIALILGMNSALTIPFVAVGCVMIAAGALGPRLNGRIAVEWGASGTVIELRTEITPPGTVAVEHGRTLPLPAVVGEQPAAEAEAEVIEGIGETIEIEVSELEALLDAAGPAAALQVSATR